MHFFSLYTLQKSKLILTVNTFQVVTSHRTPIRIKFHYMYIQFGTCNRKKSSTGCVFSQIECAVGRVINRQWMFVCV